VYLVQSKEILVPMESLGVRAVGNHLAIHRRSYDSGTLIHEITHQVMHEWLDVLPVWFVEGFAEYMAAVPFRAARFRFRDVDRGIVDHLEKAYRISPTESGFYDVDLAPPDQLMGMSHAQWSQAVADGRDAALNYRTAMMLIYFFIHLDGKGKGAPILSYLARARTGQEELHAFVSDYNRSAKEYNAALRAFNEAVAEYNDALVRFRKSVRAYNARVRTYNRQVEEGLPPDARIEVGPEPGSPPEPPRKPPLPDILTCRQSGDGIVDLAEAEQQARQALIRMRSPAELWTQLAAALRERKIRIRAVNALPGRSLTGFGDPGTTAVP